MLRIFHWKIRLVSSVAFSLCFFGAVLQTSADENLTIDYSGKEIRWFTNPITYWEIRESLKEELVDPNSLQIEKIWLARIEDKYGAKYWDLSDADREKVRDKVKDMPDLVCVMANAKNKFGGYTGTKLFLKTVISDSFDLGFFVSDAEIVADESSNLRLKLLGSSPRSALDGCLNTLSDVL